MVLFKCLLLYACLVIVATGCPKCGKACDEDKEAPVTSNEGVQVRLANGSPIRGMFRTSVSGRPFRAFPNIPFGEPPVGQLRLADPVPKAPWTEELVLSKASKVCPQYEFVFNYGARMGTEDCLYLSVYVPQNPRSPRPLPVMNFFYGGGFAVGGGELYQPDYYMEEDIILVTSNYRVGALGFMSTLTEDIPGNFGMKDQVLVLKWIRENIAQFGGDPRRVTISGESAGGASVGLHVMSPMSRGLFQKAIMQSGTPFDNFANTSSAHMLNATQRLIVALGCSYKDGDYAETLQCLRQLPEQEFLDKMAIFPVWSLHPFVTFTPVKEDKSADPFMTAEQFKDPNAGADIPVLMGINANEGAYFSAALALDPQLPELEARFDEVILDVMMFFDRFDKAAKDRNVRMIKDRYFNGHNFSWPEHQHGFADMWSEIAFVWGISRMIEKRLKSPHSANTFVYKFNYRGTYTYADFPRQFSRSNDTTDYGVAHADDLYYLFPIHKLLPLGACMSDEDHQVRRNMVKMWVNFASNGDPSIECVHWKPIKKCPMEPVDYLRIGTRDHCNMTKRTENAMESGYFEDAIRFLEKFMF